MSRAKFSRATAFALVAWLVAMLGTGSAQEWVKLREEGANFYEIQRSFYQYWEGKTPQKGQGWVQFKRWEADMEPRVYPSGILPDPDIDARAFEQYLRSKGALMKGAAMADLSSQAVPAANWTELGPTAWTAANASSTAPGLGRISGIAIHPSNPNIIFLGTPGGGLWKTTDGGASWTTSTDDLPVLGVGDIVIHPTTPSIMYIATGDYLQSTCKSVGVLKSTDGGENWFSPTPGLNWQTSQSRNINRLIMHPSDPNILLAATSNDVWKTTDGGVNWTQKKLVSTLTQYAKDIEFKPGNPTTVYAVTSSDFYKSTDTGDTWTKITSGVPVAGTNGIGVNRINIGVTPANSDYVYLLASRSDNSGFFGMYRSTNSGVSFTVQSLDTSKVNTTPNILGLEANGSSVGSIGWYALALGVSPTNADSVFIGCGNIWISSNGGVSWNNKTYWKYNLPPNPAAYVHADVHLFAFSGSTLYTGTDGGFFRSTNGGNTWTDLSAGMGIMQFQRIASASNSNNLVFGGAQDNSISRYNGSSTWQSYLSGDGAECLVDSTNSNIVYISTQSGSISRSANGGATFSSIKSNINETGAWVTPFVMAPNANTTLYAGYVNVWKTTVSGVGANAWMNISNGNVGTGTFVDLQVARSNPQYIYGVKSNKVYKTINGGTNWTDITPAGVTAAFTRIAVASNNPDKIWITLSGYISGTKVYTSSNGGTSWTNYSGTLPNVPFNTVVYHNNGGLDALYAGADIGVFYRDPTMTDWVLYQTGLPNAPVRDLEVHANSSKLRAATFGRGMWQVDLVPAPAAALAFDGVNDYVNTPSRTFGTADLTIEAWLHPNSADPGEIVLAQDISGVTANQFRIGYSHVNGDFYVMMSNTTNSVNLEPGGGFNYAITTTLPANQWSHIAFTRQGTAHNLYVNGVLVDSYTTASAIDHNSTTPFRIGARGNAGPQNPFDGRVDEVRFWNQALSAAQISAKMNCELTGTETGLVAYYNFNHGRTGGNNAGETTLDDITANNNDGTLNNFALTGTTSNWVAPGGVVSGTNCPAPPPVAGATLAFDGVNDYVSSSVLSTATTNVTLEGWVKWAGSTGNDQMIFYHGNSNTNGFGILISNDLGLMILRGGGPTLITELYPTVGVWTHFAMVSTGAGLNVYWDGALFNADPFGPINAPTTGFGIGAKPQDGSSNFNGLFDEVRFWNVARSEADIQATMNCELTGTEAGLVAYYKFNQGIDGGNNAGVTTLDDLTANNNDGTLNNFALTGTTSNWVAPGGVISGTTCTMAALAANAGKDIPNSGGATKLKGSASGGGGAYTYAWAIESGPNMGGEQFSQATQPKPVFTPAAKGTYLLRFTVKDGMNNLASDQVSVTVNTLATASVSGPDPVNPGTQYTYTAATDASNPSYFWSVINGTIVGDNDQSSVQVEAGGPQAEMLVEVYVTDGLTNDVTYASKSVTVTNQFALTANAGPDRNLPAGASTALGGNPAAVGGIDPLTYEWSPATGLNDPTLANPLASPAATTTYLLTVTDGYNTIATDQVTVTVITITNAYGELLDFIAGLNIPSGLKNSLSTKVKNSQKSFEKGNTNAAINQLNAFINEVNAQRGKKLTEEQADALIAQAQAIIDAINAGSAAAQKAQGAAIPDAYELEQNYPNPFNPETEISFGLPEAGNVTLKIFSITGQEVRTLADGAFQAGYQTVRWDARDQFGKTVAAGVYLYQITAGGANGEMKFTQTRKMAFVK